MSRRPLPVRGKAAFAALAQAPRRSRSGPVAVRFLPEDPTQAVRVAFAVGRRYGNAVERNFCRRRLRSIVAELDGLASGSYLITVDPGARSIPFRELRERVFEAMNRAGDGVGS